MTTRRFEHEKEEAGKQHDTRPHEQASQSPHSHKLLGARVGGRFLDLVCLVAAADRTKPTAPMNQIGKRAAQRPSPNVLICLDPSG